MTIDRKDVLVGLACMLILVLSMWLVVTSQNHSVPEIAPTGKIGSKAIPPAKEVSGKGAVAKAPPSSSPSVATEDLTTKYIRSTNLADFVAENSKAAMAGDGKAARLIQNAYADCASVGKDSSDYVSFMMTTVGKELSDSKRDAYQNALQSKVSRCTALNATNYPPGTIKHWSDLAIKEGDLTSQTATLLPLINSKVTQSDVQNLLAKIVNARDGDAIAQLGGIMATASASQAAIYGNYSGKEIDAYVWQLAACSFGADCTAGGSPLRNMCLISGECGYLTLDDAYRDFLSPVQYNEIVKRQSELVAALQHRGVSSNNLARRF